MALQDRHEHRHVTNTVYASIQRHVIMILLFRMLH